MEQSPPANGRPGYKDLYEAINGLRAEFNKSIAESEQRILAEMRASEHRRIVAETELKVGLQHDLEEEREAREVLSKVVMEIRDNMLKALGAIAVFLLVWQLVGSSIVERLFGQAG